ncbi:ATP-binding protein [Salipaludibacillus keqinensis]|uniref:ATP-binding protein n=1 Tax=Salipaludibacillus keqinensis TaxID=2045207 RepID=UPI001E304C90|nr:ATP-binding protein [Salipaludibacillus keqinensis]
MTATTTLLLEHMMKQLRPTTIAQNYEALPREAEERNLSYEEYLLALLDLEVKHEKKI